MGSWHRRGEPVTAASTAQSWPRSGGNPQTPREGSAYVGQLGGCGCAILVAVVGHGLLGSRSNASLYAKQVFAFQLESKQSSAAALPVKAR